MKCKEAWLRTFKLAREARVFWPKLPRKVSLSLRTLPRKLGRGPVCQALPGHSFPTSSAKNLGSLGFARSACAQAPDARVK